MLRTSGVATMTPILGKRAIIIMKSKTNFLILSALAVPVAALLVGRWLAARQTRQNVADLFSQVETGPAKIYDPAQLTGLPAPVQRYFRHVLKPGQPYVRSVRLRHDGQFKTDLNKDWIDITGEEYFVADKPAYIWNGTTTWFSACDQYVAGRGSLKVHLMGAFPIQHFSGPVADESELLRYLAETVWFPTSLLPGGPAVWSPIDDNSATLTLTNYGLAISCQMYFDRKGEIVRYQAQRYIDTTHRIPWTGQLSDYREVDGISIPFQASAAWVIDGVEQPYARFMVREIEYDQPHPY